MVSPEIKPTSPTVAEGKIRIRINVNSALATLSILFSQELYKDVFEDCVDQCHTVGYTLPKLEVNIHKLQEATQVLSDLDPLITGHMCLTGSNTQLSNTPLLRLAQKWLNEIVNVNHGNMTVLLESSAPESMADRLKRLQLCCTNISAVVSSEDAAEIGGLYARGCNTLTECIRSLLGYAEDEVQSILHKDSPWPETCHLGPLLALVQRRSF
jgi:hypothetical protein